MKMNTDIHIGDIFTCDWGYDQTNIDFIMVWEISKTGKTCECVMASVKKKIVGTQKKIVPVSQSGHGDTFRMRINKTNGISLSGSYPYCPGDTRRDTFFPWNGKPLYETGPGFGH